VYPIKSRLPWLWTLFLLLGLVLLLSACKGGAAAQPSSTPEPLPTNTPAPSATKEPSATPAPTDTPVPSDTPEPTATSTPDTAATKAAAATQAAEDAFALIQADLKKINLDLPPGSLGWIQTEGETIEMIGGEQWIYEPFAEDLVAEDFILKTDITWESSGGLAVCGFYFRSEPNIEEGEQYLFEMVRLSGLPAWDITLYEYGEPKKFITNMLTASAIDQSQGATNELIFMAKGGEFTLFINDQRIGTYFDYAETRQDGYFAFDAWQESGETTCTFENAWLWLIEEE
jgi:hypothetical protein